MSSPTEVNNMAPISNQPMEFPRWDESTEKPNEDYFDRSGKLVGGVRLFGSRWQAWIYESGTFADNTFRTTGNDQGLYFNKELAKVAVEKIASRIASRIHE